MTSPICPSAATQRAVRHRWFGAAITLAVLTACSIPFDNEPRAISTTTSTTTAEPPAPAGSATAEIFLVFENRLLLVSRNLQDTSPANVMRALLTAPSATEQSADIRTAIPPNTTLVGATTDDGLLELSLGEDFTSIRSAEFTRAVAQVVLSVTGSPGVERVQLLSEDDEVIPIPTPDGDKSSVTDCDFASLLANPADVTDAVPDVDDLQALTVRRADLATRCA